MGSSFPGGHGQRESRECVAEGGHTPSSSSRGQQLPNKFGLPSGFSLRPWGHMSPHGSLPEFCLGLGTCV